MRPFSEVQERLIGYYMSLYYGKTMVISEPTTGRSVSMQWDFTYADYTCLAAPYYESLYQHLRLAIESSSFTKWTLENGLRVAELELEGKPIGWFLRKKHDFYKGQRETIKRKNAKTVKFFISYGDALQENTAKFFYAMGWTVLQSFGTTETFGFATLDDPTAPQPLTAGMSLTGVEIQIEKYGPVLVKGASIFPTYWKQVKATAQAFDSAGFFRSEIKGHTNTNGCLVLSPPRTTLTTQKIQEDTPISTVKPTENEPSTTENPMQEQN